MCDAFEKMFQCIKSFRGLTIRDTIYVLEWNEGEGELSSSERVVRFLLALDCKQQQTMLSVQQVLEPFKCAKAEVVSWYPNSIQDVFNRRTAISSIHRGIKDEL